jgi:hypothetical protein
MSDGFRFQIRQWRERILPVASRPPYPPVRLVIDPSYTASSTSDESSVAVGFLDEDSALTVLDCVHGRFKGLDLPDQIVSSIELWRPQRVWLERNGNGACDLLMDTIVLRAEMREVSIPIIETFVPNNRVGAKSLRIRQLQNLIDQHLFHISPGPYVSALLAETERYDFESSDNHRRSDSMLDSLALLAGFR